MEWSDQELLAQLESPDGTVRGRGQYNTSQKYWERLFNRLFREYRGRGMDDGIKGCIGSGINDALKEFFNNPKIHKSKSREGSLFWLLLEMSRRRTIDEIRRMVAPATRRKYELRTLLGELMQAYRLQAIEREGFVAQLTQAFKNQPSAIKIIQKAAEAYCDSTFTDEELQERLDAACLFASDSLSFNDEIQSIHTQEIDPLEDLDLKLIDGQITEREFIDKIFFFLPEERERMILQEAGFSINEATVYFLREVYQCKPAVIELILNKSSDSISGLYDAARKKIKNARGTFS